MEISQNEDDLSYYLSIKQFLFEFRNNPDILLQFIGTLTNSDDQYLAAKVLMHFFFEDVTQAESSAPLEDMLTMFLSKEIPNVPDFFVDSFPSESNFFGKLIKEMGNRNEVKVHVKDIVADIVKELESYQYNQNEYHVTLNIGELNQILVDVKENNGKNRNDSFEVIDKNNTGNYDIRKSKPLSGSMHYKTRSMNTTGLTIDKAVGVTKSIYFPNYGNSNNDLSKMQTEDGLYGNLINIDSKYLRNAMKNETNEFMKIFYMKHINNITSEDKEGKTFKGWQDASGKIVSTEKSYTFTVNGETTLTAVYEDKPSGGGEITPPAKKDGLSGGAIAGIVIGSVAVAGIGGFAFLWFAVKKKTFADLIAAIKALCAKKK